MSNKNENSGSLKRELGLAAATAIVIGNMIGSGIFMAPQNLAAASNPKATMVGWIITALGSILIALVFARLSLVKAEAGGLVVYTKEAFGEFAGFLIAWSYWIASWISNAAVITVFISYLTYFAPVFGTNRLLAFLMSTLILWLFTWINIKGSKGVGMIGIVTTICKILPIIIFIVIAAAHFTPSNFNTVSDAKLSGMGTVPSAIAITLFSFIGLESASVAAGDIKDPQKNVYKSTIFGILFTAVIYILVSLFAIGAMDQTTLSKSAAPLADVINKSAGVSWGGALIAIGALISTLGTSAGWILVTARVPYSAAQDNMFPEVFGKLDAKTQTPKNALIISAIATNIMLILNAVGSLQSAFEFMLLLGTLAYLPAYAFVSAGEIMIKKKKSEKISFGTFMKSSFLSLLAFAYAIYAIYGTGSEAVMYGFILMLIGIPFFVYMRMKNGDKKAEIGTYNNSL